MNREIKFRIWSFTQRRWLQDSYGDFLALDLDGGVIRVQTDSCENPSSDVNENLVVEQYIGKKDKNGKEIFDGDVVRILYTDWPSKSMADPRTIEEYLIDISLLGKVEFIDNGWYVALWSKRNREWKTREVEPGAHGFIEVIGNIHENPELLS